MKQGIVEEAEFSLAQRVCEKPLPASGHSALVIYKLLILSPSQQINSFLEFTSNESFLSGSTLHMCTFLSHSSKFSFFLKIILNPQEIMDHALSISSRFSTAIYYWTLVILFTHFKNILASKCFILISFNSAKSKPTLKFHVVIEKILFCFFEILM